MKRILKNLILVSFAFFTLTMYGQDKGKTVEREGFVIGIGVGVGAVTTSDSDQSTSFDEAQEGISLPNLKLGWMLNDRLAVMATFPGMIYSHEGKDRSFDAIIPSLQYWVQDRWWVSGGVGLAMDYTALYEKGAFKDGTLNFGKAVAISSGFELVQKKNYAMDLQAKVHFGRVNLGDSRYRDAAAISIGIGFNWY